MVCYCCVKGCKNNSNLKKKDPTSTISFHGFPCNPDIKSKWLKAIGRPNWDPPAHSRICSIHFNNDDINYEGSRIRIKDNACPINYLPLNSNFETSHMEVCRICLATDLKMYSLQDEILNSCFVAFNKLNEKNHIEGMPQTVCYECRACLIKCNTLLEKSMIAQATLLDVFAKHGKITMDLIRKQDRRQLNLISSLSCFKTTHIYEICSNLDSEDSNSMCINKYDTDVKNENYLREMTLKSEVINKGIKSESYEILFNNDEVDLNDDNDSVVDKDCTSIIDSVLVDHDPFKSENKEKIVISCDKMEKTKFKSKRKKINGLTPSEVNMQKHFDIVKLSLQEQIEEWKKTLASRPLTSETIFECEICSRKFATNKACDTHVLSHDNRRGKEECPVCRLRFKTKTHAQTHRNRAHGKKFYCKKCPKAFNTVRIAKRHNRWHSGHRYKCKWCSFASAHEASVGAHVRRSHAHEQGTRACVRCGVTCRTERGLTQHVATAHRNQTEIEVSDKYRCEQCYVNFASEGARRVHLLTSNHHNTKLDLCMTSSSIDNCIMKTTCRKCGEEFSCYKELRDHNKTAHYVNSRRKPTWTLPTDIYPTLCEHCGETVNNRKEHWLHYLRKHPKNKHLYQAVITAVCETCGKGFQNSAKLHLHELRHGRPTVQCTHCPRLFYDKFAMSRHSSVHNTARPYACTTCGRTFKFKGNFERHSRVHTDATPYECSICYKKFKYSTSMNLHVRTVHYKMPHPPRRKRNASINDTQDINNDDI